MSQVISPAEQKQIQLDRMRFNKNTLGSRLVYLAILFDVLYFVSVYESDVGTWYYQALIGVSIVYNLVFMLVSFLASEGVKSYRIGYAWLLLVLNMPQEIRYYGRIIAVAGTYGVIGIKYNAINCRLIKAWHVARLLKARHIV